MKKILIVTALIIALLAVEVVIIKTAANYEPMVEVIYAKTKIQKNTLITEDMLIRKKINFSLVHSQAIKQEGDLIGKTAIVDIEANEMLLQSKVGQYVPMEDIELSNKDNRLFAIEFKPDQVNGWWVKVGQHVDIMCVPANLKDIKQINISGKVKEEQNTDSEKEMQQQEQVNQSKSNYGIIKLENIRIAAIIDEGGRLLANEQRTSVPKIISFELQPGQDELLAWAKGNTRIEISTRTSSED